MDGATGETEHKDDLAVPKEAGTIPPSESTPASSGLEDLTNRAICFLSQASPETIGAVVVGLAGCTYLILGRIGLVLIGTVGGVVLHATWEGQSSAGSNGDVRREKGLDIVHRILDMRKTAALKAEEDNEKDNEPVGDNFEAFRPETATALNGLVDAVIRDYVNWWYKPILPSDQTFPNATRQTLTKFILSISNHLSRKRPADTFLDFLTNSSSIVIVFLNELSSALSASQGTNVPPAEAVYTYLSANPESNLANVLNGKQQAKKFKMVADDVLQTFLEKSAYDCDPARLFLREVFAGLVLESTLTICSKPEWINGWIVYLLEEGEPDFSQAIDAGMVTGNDVLSNPFSDLDGNVGNIGVAKASKSQIERKQETKRHQKRLSKAEEAMEEAMEEARRLSQLIAEEDAKRTASSQKPLDDTPEETHNATVESTKLMGLDGTAFMVNTTVTPEQSVSPQTGTGEFSSLGNLRTNNHSERSLNSNSENSIKSLEALKTTSQNGTLQKSTEPPQSPPSSASPVSSHGAFTSFDQIVPQSIPTALQEGSPIPRRKTVSLTLHNANIIIHDDSTGSDKGKLRSKPGADYLLQIEPASSDHPGWMIVRRYPDFETLHEVLRRIAQVSGVTAFTEQHQTLPNWKEHTKASLRGELERYLRDACWYRELAESEGMKRFLEKDQGQSISGSSSKNGFPGLGWPTPSAFENMGKGMLDVLTSAPKGVAEGGKAIGGGITGVFSNIGNLGQKKATNGSVGNVGTHTAGRASTSILPRMDSMSSMNSIMQTRAGRVSEDSLRALPIVHTQPSIIPQMERRPSWNSIAEADNERQPRPSSARSSMSGQRSATISREPSRAPSRTPSRRGTPLSSPTQSTMGDMKLPPPPSNMPDDYGYPMEEKSAHARTESNVTASRTSTSTAPSQQSPGRRSLSGRRSPAPVMTPARKPRSQPTPLTEPETRVAVELLFAVINELYTLSSAWNIRRTLLTAAKTFLLRPGNPSLVSIQTLIQDSVIAANTSDAGIAGHLRKLRENSLPTEDELKGWPAELSTEDKERLRIKARKLLIERGVPAALTGVMGQAATSEAMGRMFDCLQVEEVARGLMFGLLLQAVRAVTQ
jgi:hypothetical protein